MPMDYLRDCLEDLNSQSGSKVPIDVLQKDYCVVCLNRECSRSGVSQGSFVTRARTWEKSLFISPSKAPESDSYVSKTQDAWGSVSDTKPTSVFVPANFKCQQSEPEPSPITPSTMEVEIDQNAPPTRTIITPDSPAAPKKKTVNPFAPSYVGDAPKEKEVVIESGGSFTFGE